MEIGHGGGRKPVWAVRDWERARIIGRQIGQMSKCESVKRMTRNLRICANQSCKFQFTSSPISERAMDAFYSPVKKEFPRGVVSKEREGHMHPRAIIVWKGGKEGSEW